MDEFGLQGDVLGEKVKKSSAVALHGSGEGASTSGALGFIDAHDASTTLCMMR